MSDKMNKTGEFKGVDYLTNQHGRKFYEGQKMVFAMGGYGIVKKKEGKLVLDKSVSHGDDCDCWKCRNYHHIG